jgi:hypothetical protein
MIKHLVFWKIKETALGKSKAELTAEFKAKLEALPALVPGILKLQVGLNLMSGEMCADISLDTEFASLADLDIYANHPDHLEVVAFAKQIVCERRVMDYEFS